MSIRVWCFSFLFLNILLYGITCGLYVGNNFFNVHIVKNSVVLNSLSSFYLLQLCGRELEKRCMCQHNDILTFLFLI